MRSVAPAERVPPATDASPATSSMRRLSLEEWKAQHRGTGGIGCENRHFHGRRIASIRQDANIMKKLRSAIATITRHEDVNFLLTNRIPRRFADPLVRLVQPTRASTGSRSVDRRLAPVRRSGSERGARARFRSLHDCFIRRLRDGARPIDPDPDVLVSPCDAIVGASGSVRGRSGPADQGLSLSIAGPARRMSNTPRSIGTAAT